MTEYYPGGCRGILGLVVHKGFTKVDDVWSPFGLMRVVSEEVVSLLPLPVLRVNFRFELQASIAETDSCNCLFAVSKFTLLVHTEASSVNKAISEWLGTTSGRLNENEE